MWFNILLVFLLVFSFPIVGPLNSAYLALFLALWKVVSKKRLNRVIYLFRNKYIKLLMVSSFLMVCLSAIWTKWMGANDMELTRAMFSMLVGVILSVIIISALDFKEFTTDFAEKLLVDVFVVQGLISIGSFTVPAIKDIVHHFQFDDSAPADDYYFFIRGMAMSGRLYFELAATCGLITFVQFKRIMGMQKVSYMEYIKLFLVIICGFFAGRTSMIGIVFGVGYVILYKGESKRKLRLFSKLGLTLLACVLMVVAILPASVISLITDTLAPWLFDLIIKYNETGSTEDSASFNALNEMYEYVQITDEEWVIGSGHYIDKEYGGYYKSVDGGYIRQLLYWGTIGSFFAYIYGLLYFIKPIRLCRNRNDKLYIFLILIYTFFVHYKGELAVTSRFYHVPVIMLMLPYVLKRVKRVRSKNGTDRHSYSVG
ncbi:MAG: hypothetical protein HDS80_00685 [Bacteroidales bacterium]|nr:hypothetical protein [Bacteroidales bacterium]